MPALIRHLLPRSHVPCGGRSRATQRCLEHRLDVPLDAPKGEFNGLKPGNSLSRDARVFSKRVGVPACCVLAARRVAATDGGHKKASSLHYNAAVGSLLGGPEAHSRASKLPQRLRGAFCASVHSEQISAGPPRPGSVTAPFAPPATGCGWPGAPPPVPLPDDCPEYSAAPAGPPPPGSGTPRAWR